MTQEQIAGRVSQFLAEQLRTELGPDDPIFGTGLANSMFAMQLVLFIESAFGIAIENDDLELSNFETVAAITRLVAGKNGTSA